jgi:hypothetical protein
MSAQSILKVLYPTIVRTHLSNPMLPPNSSILTIHFVIGFLWLYSCTRKYKDVSLTLNCTEMEFDFWLLTGFINMTGSREFISVILRKIGI